jgi:RND family efflux transporter MFP subunit
MKSPLLFLPLALIGCNKGPSGGPPPAPPAVSVTAVTLETRPVEDASDYLATLVSRRAIDLHPQVQGYVRRILVAPGDQVKAGAVLMQIDSRAEQASLENLVANRESLASSVSLAKQRLERATKLRVDGIVSQQEVDSARAQADQAEASLRATDALISSQRARVGFFAITAPFDGVVGHIPVKVGDFTTPAAAVTSLTQESGLEAEVWVPVERTPSLSPSSLVRLLDDAGATLAESPVTFVSARADSQSQLVLIKAAFASHPKLRADQVVRSRVVWSTRSGLTVPASSIVRQAGQPFVFLVGGADGGTPAGNLASRVPVTLGALRGRDYVVVDGLQPGQQLVVSGVQHISDGAAVTLAKAGN